MTLPYFLHRFSLDEDRANEVEIVASIRRGVVFGGVNTWILVFAIFLASIGLNVNSIPVIIGAMLVSPLMGPIMGIGLGAGIYDFTLIKKGFLNLGIMVLISIATSTIYFLISPLDQAQSELLSRTAPTIWDVMIAFFGGLAGIVAGAAKEKGTAIPGVAIATALMPPLCTAGFGIAHGDFRFFIGAFYLFCINGVFISVATFLIVRVLQFKPVALVDKRTNRRVRLTILTIVLIMMIPSCIIAWYTVRRAVFEASARSFIAAEVESPIAHVLTRKIDFDADSIALIVIGRALSPARIDSIRQRTPAYGLRGLKLSIRQGLGQANQTDMKLLKETVVRDVLALQLSLSQDSQPAENATVTKYRGMLGDSLAHEAFVVSPKLESFGLMMVPSTGKVSGRSDTLLTAFVKTTSRLTKKELVHLQEWLKVRTHTDTVGIVTH